MNRGVNRVLNDRKRVLFCSAISRLKYQNVCFNEALLLMQSSMESSLLNEIVRHVDSLRRIHSDDFMVKREWD